MSLTAWAIDTGLRATRFAERLKDETALRRVVATARRGRSDPPGWTRRWPVATTPVARGRLHRIAPQAEPRGEILFLPGGAFVFGPDAGHWRFARWLTAQGWAVTIAAYPLAPEADHRSVDQFLHEAFARWQDRNARAPFALIGDSAGANLALRLALRDRAAVQALVLITPWLDLSLSHPDQPALERRDPLLRIDGLRAAARWHAAGLTLVDPAISPLHADLSGSPRTLLFGGGRDLLVPDARRFAERASRVRYVERPLLHDWPLLLIPEARAARAQLLDFLLRG